MSQRPVPPVWLMGLSNSTLGLITGIVFFVIPQLLAARHVPETAIAAISAAAMSANAWYVIFGPMLDVRFSRRCHATIFAGIASLMAAIAVISLRHLGILAVAVVIGVAAGALSSAALGGWLATLGSQVDQNRLAAWANIAVISGVGVTSYLGGELVRNFPVVIAASLLAAIVFLPTAVFLIMPAPGPDRRLAEESFRQFSREILALFRQRKTLITLLLFISPCSSFALTTVLGGLGGDFHASAHAVSLAGGMGAFFSGISGCLLFPVIARRVPLLPLYLINGFVGGLFTLSLLLLPHMPWTFGLALVGEYLFQAIAYSVQYGIMLETIGPDNPFAATTFTFLAAATNVPVTYMIFADGKAYSVGRVAGSLGADAGISLAACLLLGLLLSRYGAIQIRQGFAA